MDRYLSLADLAGSQVEQAATGKGGKHKAGGAAAARKHIVCSACDGEFHMACVGGADRMPSDRTTWVCPSCLEVRPPPP